MKPRSGTNFVDWMSDLDRLCHERLDQGLDDLPLRRGSYREMRSYWRAGSGPREFLDEVIISVLEESPLDEGFDVRFEL